MVHYPRPLPHTSAPEWTLSHALDILGVQGAIKEEILRCKDPHEICNLFTDWNSVQSHQRGPTKSKSLLKGGTQGCCYHKHEDELNSQVSLSKRVRDGLGERVFSNFLGHGVTVLICMTTCMTMKVLFDLFDVSFHGATFH